MQKRINQFMLLLTVLAVVMTSAISTTTVHADDGTTGEPTEPAGEESQPADESAPTETVEEILDLIPEGTELIVVRFNLRSGHVSVTQNSHTFG